MTHSALLANGRVVCPELSVADTAPSRMKGLLGRRSAGMQVSSLLDLPAAMPDEFISALETRAIWARYGF